MVIQIDNYIGLDSYKLVTNPVSAGKRKHLLSWHFPIVQTFLSNQIALLLNSQNQRMWSILHTGHLAGALVQTYLSNQID